jgi:hypothetical protein
VSSGTIPSVKINGKEAAVLNSMVKTCTDPAPAENCKIVAVGSSVKPAIEIPETKPIDRSITNPKWEKAKAGVGEKVKLSVQLKNQYEYATVEYKIFPAGADTTKDQPMQKLYGRNIGGKSEVEMVFSLPEDYELPGTENEGIPPVDEIEGIQYRLNASGYNCGKITGIRNEETRKAVKAFQKGNGLKVDGIPGEKTQKKLDEVFKKKSKKEEKEAKELKYIFTAGSFGCEQVKSGTITVEPAYFEIKIEDEGKMPCLEKYSIELNDGTVIEGEPDYNGYVKVYVKDGKSSKIILTDFDSELWGLN